MEIVKVAAKASQRSKCHAKVATTDVRHIKKRRKKLENQNSCFRNWSSHTNIIHCGLPGYLACRKREKTSRQRAQETENRKHRIVWGSLLKGFNCDDILVLWSRIPFSRSEKRMLEWLDSFNRLYSL